MIKVIQADITTLQVDAIVNAANSSLLGGGGVDGAIHDAAGPELKDACRKLGGCPTGEVRLTPGFRLPAKWVIHVVGPIWHGGYSGEVDLLRACYEGSLRLALEQGARSIAFPSIGTGAYRFPKDKAAHIAVEAMRRYEDKFDEIVCCCFSSADKEIYEQALAEVPG